MRFRHETRSVEPENAKPEHAKPEDAEQAPSHGEEYEFSEAYDQLIALARRKVGSVPPELVAAHVIEIYRDAPWAVKRAALEALLRRFAFARQDGLRVGERPPGAKPFGAYRTRTGRRALRPYRSVLRSLTPLVGSCDCPDFLRGSLGLCKHLLVVLDTLAAKPRKLEQALRANEQPAVQRRPARLSWDPIRPLVGVGDWLERVRLEAAPGVAAPGRALSKRRAHSAGRTAASKSTNPKKQSAAWHRLSAHFAADAAGVARLKHTWPEQPERRLGLVKDLLGALPRLGSELDDDPALRALLLGEKQRLESQLEARGGPKPSLRGVRRALYPYQSEGVARFLAAERLLLADDMGLGKTAQAAAACHALHRAGRVRRGLVITPASLKGQWAREWAATTRVPVEVIDGPPTERASAYARTTDGFLIVNYEQLLRDLDEVLAWDPEIVVLDEAQRIKNWATKTASFVKRLRPRYRLVLTGTPMENRLDELASIMDWVDDHALEPKWRLAPWHAVSADGSREVIGARDLCTLRARLAPSMLRRVRADVLSQLPPRTDTLIPVEMTAAQREEHDALDPPIAQLASRARKRPLTQAEFLRLMALLTEKRIIANGLAQHRFDEVWPGIERARPREALLQSLSSPKLVEARSLLATLAIEQGRKVVVFSQWRRMLRLVHWAVGDLLASAGVRALFFTGRESSRQRTRNLVDFHDDPAARILFASDAGGVGLNLQRAASACMLLDLPWNPAVLEQRVGRIYRMGQKRPIDVYSLVSSDSIEERIASLVADKRALFCGLFDGSSDQVEFDRSGSFLASVAKLVGVDAAAEGSADAPETEDRDDDAEGAEAELQSWLHEEEEEDSEDEAPGDRRVRDGGRLASTTDAERIHDKAPPRPSERSQAHDSVDTDRPTQSSDRTSDATAVTASGDLSRLFADLIVERTEQGALRIEAPPETADTLAALLEGFAGALRRGAR